MVAVEGRVRSLVHQPTSPPAHQYMYSFVRSSRYTLTPPYPFPPHRQVAVGGAEEEEEEEEPSDDEGAEEEMSAQPMVAVAPGGLATTEISMGNESGRTCAGGWGTTTTITTSTTLIIATATTRLPPGEGALRQDLVVRAVSPPRPAVPPPDSQARAAA